MTFKLNVLLAKTDAMASQFKNLIRDYGRFFGNKQEAFRGEQKTYEAKEGTIDDPKRRGNVLVQTTVGEKLDYFVTTSAPYINAVFSQEATNASGSAQAELIVEGKSWGTYTSLELLRLKSIIETKELNAMYSTLPVRSDSQIWKESSNEMYSGRPIWEGPKVETENKTTEKETYIMVDPNLGKIDASKYTPLTSVKNTVVVLGQGTHQRFSGEISHRERATILGRISTLKVSVIEALKRANEAEVIESKLTAETIFGYLHNGNPGE